MESMNTAELLQIALLLRDDMEDQFEFWLYITFAVIISSFVGGEKILPSWRVMIGGLYFLTTGLFAIRFQMSNKIFSIT